MLYKEFLREFKSDKNDPEDNNSEIYDKLNDHLMDLARRLTNSVKKFGQFNKNFVLYENETKFGEKNKCGNCLFFRNEQNLCGIVEGKIVGTAGCRFFIV